MRTRVGSSLMVGLLVAAWAVAGPASKQKQPEQKMSMDDMEKSCRERCQRTSDSIDRTMSMLDDSRKSNDAAQMRKAMDDARKSMAEMKEHMSGCMGMMDKMGQMHGGMMGEKGMMGGGMMSGDKTAAKVTDPVCGMQVDPKTAPSATHNGKTYYFCSPEDKAKFEKNPETYVKKKPA